MFSLKKITYSLNGLLLKVALFFILLMMFGTVIDVLLRYIFNRPIPGVFEVTRYALAIIVFASLGWSQIHKVHIAIDLFITRIPLFWQNLIEVLNYLVVFVVFSLAFWQMLVYTGRLYASDLITTVLRIHVYPWVLLAAVGVLFFVLALFGDLIGNIRKLMGRVDSDGVTSSWDS